jgi:hypothetical protein
MKRNHLALAIERKDLDLATQGGIGAVCLKMITEAGDRGMTFPEIAEVLFADRYSLEECEELGFALERLLAGGAQ